GETSEKPGQGAERRDESGEKERRQRSDALGARGVKGEGDESGWPEANSDGSGRTSGDTEWACQIGLPDAKNGQGGEFQQKPGAVEDEIDGDKAFEGEIESEGPADCAGNHADPGNSA